MKNPFTIPDNTKITDKAFARVLFSLVCSILLCMGCLVGTTWAWFVASIENEGNVIEIATISTAATVYAGDVEMTPDPDGNYALPVGTYTMQVQVTNTATDSIRPIYVLMTVTQNNRHQQFYLALDGGVTDTTITVTVEKDPAILFLSARWTQPVSTQIVDAVTLTQVTGDSTTSTTPDDSTTTEMMDTTTTTETEPTTDGGETTTSTTEDVTTTTDTIETTTTSEVFETTTTDTEVTTTTTTDAAPVTTTTIAE